MSDVALGAGGSCVIVHAGTPVGAKDAPVSATMAGPQRPDVQESSGMYTRGCIRPGPSRKRQLDGRLAEGGAVVHECVRAPNYLDSMDAICISSTNKNQRSTTEECSREGVVYVAIRAFGRPLDGRLAWGLRFAAVAEAVVSSLPPPSGISTLMSYKRMRLVRRCGTWRWSQRTSTTASTGSWTCRHIACQRTSTLPRRRLRRRIKTPGRT